MIVLAGALDQLGLEVAADFGEDASKVTDCEVREHIATIFRDEDQMGVKSIDDVSTLADIHVAAPKTNL